MLATRSYSFIFESLIFLLLSNKLIQSFSFSSENFSRSDEFVYEKKFNEIKVFNVKTREKHASQHLKPSRYTEDVSEFVAKVRGGLEQAQRIADKFELKLVKRVFEHSNYFLFRQEHLDKNTVALVNEYANREESSEFSSARGLNSTDGGETELKRFKRVRRGFKSKRQLRLRRSLDFNELNKLKQEPEVIFSIRLSNILSAEYPK